MKPYLDTNFLLRAFLDYEDTELALKNLRRLRASKTSCAITWLHRLEYGNALNLMVFQSRSGGTPHVTPENAAIANHDFEAALQPAGALREASLSTHDLTILGLSISARHSAHHGFRTYDIIHVASAVLLRCDAFWSFDTRANKLAEMEGLSTL